MRIPVALCLAALLLAVPASAATFKMISQNTLHYGWGEGAANRNLTFQNVFSQADVIVVQELMDDTKLGELSPGAGYTVRVSPLLGRSTYLEAYGFIIRNNLNPQAVKVNLDLAGISPNYTDFSRPPAFIELRPGAQNTWTWIGNVHICFGKVKRRKDEAAKMITAMGAVTGSTFTRVVIGGDWNLNAKQLTSAGLTHAEPDLETSINPIGQFASKYDHFIGRPNLIFFNAVRIDPTTLNPAFTLPKWRKDISDHAGISCVVNY